MITKLGMVSFIIVPFIYVIYQQASITVQYKINLKCMFKDILYPTLHSLQNLTLDGCTGTLVLWWTDFKICLSSVDLHKRFKNL